MAVDLTTLVPSLKREINPPGMDLYPTAGDSDYLGYLQDAFWEARLNGMLIGYVESGGLITPSSGVTDMPRELQQLIVLFAGFRVVMTAFQNINSSFRSKAGPVEYEVQKSAQTLKTLLDAIRERMQFVIQSLSIYGGIVDTVQFDQVVERSYSMATHDLWYVR